MKVTNINALSVYFADNKDKLVALRYTFSLKDDEGKEKIYCDIVCGDFDKHRRFLCSLAGKAERGFVQYLHEFNTALLYEEVQNIFLPNEEEKKEEKVEDNVTSGPWELSPGGAQ